MVNEGEQIIVSVGTRTPLSVDLTLEYAGTAIPLDCSTAFTCDVRVLRQAIGTEG